MKKPRIIVLIFGLLLALALSTRFPKWDANRETPRDVVRKFLSSVQAGDFDKARGYWSDGSVANIERYFEMSFRDFCRARFDCREFRVGSALKQKGEYWTVDYLPNCSSFKDYELYVAPIDGRYQLTYHLWEPPKSGEPESESKASED